MKILDECVPWPLHRLLAPHLCRTAQQMGWGGITNGELLRLAESEFDLFITSDLSLRYQQNRTGRLLPIIELSSNKWRPIKAAAPQITACIATVSAGAFVRIEIPEIS